MDLGLHGFRMACVCIGLATAAFEVTLGGLGISSLFVC